MRRFYASSAAYRNHLAEKSQLHYRHFLDLIKRHVPPHSRILEIGAGTGQVAHALAQQGHCVIATDLSALFLKTARQLSEESSVQPQFLVADINTLPFATSSFDAVAGGELLEHLADVPHALEEMIRVLRPGGVLILRSPALAAPVWPLMDLPRLLTGRGGRPPHYENLPQAAAFLFRNSMRCLRIALRIEPRFERRAPDLDLAVEGGDRDAAYWSSAIEISRYLRSHGMQIRQIIDIGNRGIVIKMMAKTITWLWPTISIVAVKKN